MAPGPSFGASSRSRDRASWARAWFAGAADPLCHELATVGGLRAVGHGLQQLMWPAGTRAYDANRTRSLS
jgi:hypothetical protein